ncbi:MAG: fibronectin type III domain-containing protein [Vicinamibacterales bacterium]
MDAPTQYSANTTFAYNRQSAPDPAQRWGDYSFTSVDPTGRSNPSTLQYVNATNSYAVRLVKLLAPAPAVMSAGAVSPSTVNAGLAGVNVTVTGAATGGRGFFDPGAGFARRIAASFGAGVTVTNVVVNSPTSLTLTLNTVGATAGARTLTVTNPDGQTSTLASALTIGTPQPGPPVFSNAPGNQQVFDLGAGHRRHTDAGVPGGRSRWVGVHSHRVVFEHSGRARQPHPTHGARWPRQCRACRQQRPVCSSTTHPAGAGGSQPGQLHHRHLVVTVSQSVVAGAPQNLAAVVVRNRVTFTWDAPASAGVEPVLSYRIEAGFGPGQTAALLPAGNVTTYTVFAAPDGVFFVRVRAQTAAGLSSPSNEVQIATGQAAPPLAPQALLATVQGTSIALQWTENPNGPVIGAYYLLAGSAPGLADIGVLPLPATARTFAALAPPGTYYVRIAAVNAAGTGAPSNEAALVAQPATCTIPATPTGATDRRPAATTFGWAAALTSAHSTTTRSRSGRRRGCRTSACSRWPATFVVVSGLVNLGPHSPASPR